MVFVIFLIMALTVCMTALFLFHCLLTYRLWKILDWLHTPEGADVTLEQIKEAQRRFWVWPIRKAFR